MPKRNPKPATEIPVKGETPVVSPPPTEATPRKSRARKSTVSVEVDVNPVRTGRPRASDESVARRQDTAYRLHLLGKTPEEISEIMGVADRTVRDYLLKGRERQTTELRRLEGRAGVMRQFAVLNHVLEEMLERWEKSKRTKKTKTAGVETKDLAVGGKGLPATETKKKSSQTEEEVLGDVAFIDRALRASKEIRELLGLDAPEVKRLLLAEDPLSKDLNDENLRTLPPEELLRRYRASAGLSSELG
ncbi:MAG: hypothetical protein ABL984_00530 [Pyrinomonadaceae bacterium]